MSKLGGKVPVVIVAHIDESTTTPSDEELHLIKQIELFSVRERKILRIIKEHREKPGGLAVDAVTKTTRELDDDEDENNKKGFTTTTTSTEATNSIICRW